MIESVLANIVYRHHSKLGEGTYWDESKNIFYWVDIVDCKLFIYDPKKRENTVFNIGENVSSVILTKTGSIILALEKSLAYFDIKTGSIDKFIFRSKEKTSIRFNDGKCDPKGRFWVGTMAYDFTEGAGSLFCLKDKNNLEIRIENVTISNGLVWNKTNNKFFFIDSHTQEIQSFDYFIKTNDIKNKKIIHRIPESIGMPDGMSIDENDNLWVAIYGGSKVIRINPN